MNNSISNPIGNNKATSLFMDAGIIAVGALFSNIVGNFLKSKVDFFQNPYLMGATKIVSAGFIASKVKNKEAQKFLVGVMAEGGIDIISQLIAMGRNDSQTTTMTAGGNVALIQ